MRGVMLECDAVIHRDLDTVGALGREIFTRYASPRGADRSLLGRESGESAEELPAEVAAMVEKQASKRVGLEFVELRRASLDHRKLGGTY